MWPHALSRNSKHFCATFIVTDRDSVKEESGEVGLAKKWADDGDDVRKDALTYRECINKRSNCTCCME